VTLAKKTFHTQDGMWRTVVALAALFSALFHWHHATLESQGSLRQGQMKDIPVAERCRRRGGVSSEATLCILVGVEVDVFVREQMYLPPSDNLLALSALRLNRTFIVLKLVSILKLGSTRMAAPDSVTSLSLRRHKNQATSMFCLTRAMFCWFVRCDICRVF
jgi:hypothetical protein